MNHRLLISSDLHLTSRAKDAYRLGIMDWLAETAEEYECTEVVLLGDLTEFKDEHDSWLVNFICNKLLEIAEICSVVILRGNHDCHDPEHPFFEFVDHYEGVYFINEPQIIGLGEYGSALCLPHSRDPQKEWPKKLFNKQVMNEVDYVFLHQSFAGAKAESGKSMDGIPTKWFKNIDAQVFSGDIHLPQKLGPVRYIGSPYSVRFGDEFEPRVMLLEDGKRTDLHFPAPRKWKLTLNADMKPDKDAFQPGDMVKITVRLPRRELSSWADYRRAVNEFCQEHELELHDTQIEVEEDEQSTDAVAEQEVESEEDLDISNHEEVFEDYCSRESVTDSTRTVGRELVAGYFGSG